jgi:hypothetical protein
MDQSYKFFIHLYDIESGDIIAQADVIPRDWTYPTTWWEAGEVVSDEIQLTSVVPGQYQLAVGVYDPETGERLCAQDYGDLVVVSDSLILQEVTVP